MASAVIPKEEQEQEALAEWLDYKRILWTHVPNEGRRKPQYNAKLKRLGLKKGVPDILIFDPPRKGEGFVGVAIELKRKKGGRVSPEQEGWLEALKEVGWYATVCNGADEAINILTSLGY
jgi:hypothetical protein